ncbi:junctional adhesion molecule A-like [Limulus polyphemus]|uniref:Junctional adhesion molecule A-like n=1 Tax=Limulus polyphemus TaxID=6850 RepID=A0ABM1SQM7_LIMPO|nr:junctional adhesion molecule A-like [Limulus polyphemus]
MAAKLGVVLLIYTQSLLCLVSSSDPPKIQPFSFPVNLQVGSPIRVTCGLEKGSPPLTFTWKKNGIQLKPIPNKVRFLEDEGFVMLEIKRLDASDVANYTCVARNSAGEDWFTSHLLVKEGASGML